MRARKLVRLMDEHHARGWEDGHNGRHRNVSRFGGEIPWLDRPLRWAYDAGHREGEAASAEYARHLAAIMASTGPLIGTPHPGTP